jgi:hypothetical protein
MVGSKPLLFGGETNLASAVLAGETETRVQVEDIALDGMTLRVVSPPKRSPGNR